MRKGTVKIAGVPYKVVVTGTWKDVSHDDMADLNHAEICYLTHSIRVRGDAPKELVSRAFLHEVVHGVVAGLHIRELEDEETGGHNEIAVDQLAVGITEALESLGIDIYSHLPLPKAKGGKK